MHKTIDITTAIERQGLGRLAILALVLATLMMLADGYDFAALTLAAPAIMREWHTTPKSLGLVFSATFFGLLCGSLFYGQLADRFGRKRIIVLGTLNFSLPTLLTLWAANTGELEVLRFVGGLGMGGIMPVAYALISDYAPKRLRSTVTVIASFGYTVGFALTGLVAAWLIPRFGWQALFGVGGVFSILLTLVLATWLPESPQYFILHHPTAPALRRIAERLIGHALPQDAQFSAVDPQEEPCAPGEDNLRQLFFGPRAIATTLLWILFVFDSLGFFFLISWGPVVMEMRGVLPSTASLMQSLFGIAGIAGGLLVMRFLDRLGPMAMVILPILGAPIEVLLGTPFISQNVLLMAVFGAGVCLAGIHIAVYAIAVRFYPPSIRARGVSIATVWGRAGGIVAPYVGGFLLSAHMPLLQLMLIAALPCLVTAATGIGLGVVYRRHFEIGSVPETASA